MATSSNSDKKIITTGFLKVTFAKLLEIKCNNIGVLERKTLWNKGKQLVIAKHFIEVKEIQETGKPTSIIGHCVKSMSDNEKWTVELLLDENRSVTSAHCSCWVGERGDCKHTAGLIIFINEFREESQTDQPCAWKKPSKKAMETYKKGESFDDIRGHKVKFIPHDFARMTEEARKEQKEFMETAKNTKSPLYKHVCLDQNSSEEKSKNCDIVVFPEWIFEKIFQVEKQPTLNIELDGEELSFHNNELVLSHEKSFELCKLTKEQSKSALWRIERKKRITASKCHKIAHARTPETRKNYLLEDKTLGGLPQLKYGIETEEEARNFYEKGTGNNVEQVGLIVKTSKPFLAASPDGLFLKDGELCILEIKCPFTKKDANNVKDCDFLTEQGYLKKSHPYFCQVQMQMFVCNATLCHFFVYAPKAHHLVQIQYDEQFC